jgi:hypothetical protein
MVWKEEKVAKFEKVPKERKRRRKEKETKTESGESGEREMESRKERRKGGKTKGPKKRCLSNEIEPTNGKEKEICGKKTGKDSRRDRQREKGI